MKKTEKTIAVAMFFCGIALVGVSANVTSRDASIVSPRSNRAVVSSRPGLPESLLPLPDGTKHDAYTTREGTKAGKGWPWPPWYIRGSLRGCLCLAGAASNGLIGKYNGTCASICSAEGFMPCPAVSLPGQEGSASICSAEGRLMLAVERSSP